MGLPLTHIYPTIQNHSCHTFNRLDIQATFCENLAPFLKPEAKTPRLVSNDFGCGLEIKLVACLKLRDENINVLIGRRD